MYVYMYLYIHEVSAAAADAANVPPTPKPGGAASVVTIYYSIVNSSTGVVECTGLRLIAAGTRPSSDRTFGAMERTE